MPEDDWLIQRLVEALTEREDIAAAYAGDSSPIQTAVRSSATQGHLTILTNPL